MFVTSLPFESVIFTVFTELVTLPTSVIVPLFVQVTVWLEAKFDALHSFEVNAFPSYTLLFVAAVTVVVLFHTAYNFTGLLSVYVPDASYFLLVAVLLSDQPANVYPLLIGVVEHKVVVPPFALYSTEYPTLNELLTIVVVFDKLSLAVIHK